MSGPTCQDMDRYLTGDNEITAYKEADGAYVIDEQTGEKALAKTCPQKIAPKMSVEEFKAMTGTRLKTEVAKIQAALDRITTK